MISERWNWILVYVGLFTIAICVQDVYTVSLKLVLLNKKYKENNRVRLKVVCRIRFLKKINRQTFTCKCFSY